MQLFKVEGVTVGVGVGLQAPFRQPAEHNDSDHAAPSLLQVSNLEASPALHRNAPGVHNPPAHVLLSGEHPL